MRTLNRYLSRRSSSDSSSKPSYAASVFVTLSTPGMEIGMLLIVSGAALPPLPASTAVALALTKPSLPITASSSVANLKPSIVQKREPAGIVLPLVPLMVSTTIALVAAFLSTPYCSVIMVRYSPHEVSANDAL